MNSKNDEKWKVSELSPGLWVVEVREIDEEKGQESLMDMLEKELEYIDDTIVDYQLNQLSKGVWIIKLDETSQIIQRIKDKLRNIFKNE